MKYKCRGTVKRVFVHKLLEGVVPSVAGIPEWQLQQDQWQTEGNPKKCGLIKKDLILMLASKPHEVISIFKCEILGRKGLHCNQAVTLRWYKITVCIVFCPRTIERICYSGFSNWWFSRPTYEALPVPVAVRSKA